MSALLCVLAAGALWTTERAAAAEDAVTSELRAFRAAERLMAAEHYEQAGLAFAQVLRDYPDGGFNLAALFRQGLCAYQLSRWADARALWERAAARLTSPADGAESASLREAVTFYLAELNYREGRYAEAIRQYHDVLATPTQTPYKPVAQAGVGWAYYQLGQCAESFAAFESLRREQAAMTLRGTSLFALGDCARRLGRSEEAVQVLRQLIAQEPKNPWADDAGLMLVELLTARGQEREAMALAEQLLSDYAGSPSAPGLHVHAGQLALKGHALESARAHFDAVVTRGETSPYFVGALVGVGDVAFEAGAFDEAARHYARVVLAAPHGPYAAYALFQQAQALFNAGQWSKVRYLYDQVVAQFPGSRFVEEALFRLGEAWAIEGYVTQAIEHYARLAHLSPRSPWAARAQLAWAQLLSRAGRWDEAQTIYEQLMQESADRETTDVATVRYALALAERGRMTEARAMVERLLEQPASALVRGEAFLALAQWARSQEDWTQAADMLTRARQAAAGTPLEPEVQFWQGWIAFQYGGLTEACDVWDQLLSSAPQHARVAECRPWRLLLQTKLQGVSSALAMLTSWLPQLAVGGLEEVGRQWAGSLREDGLAAEAVQVYTFCRQHVPEAARPEWHYLLGETYEELHQRASALAMYRRAAEAHPAQPWAVRGALAAARLLESDERWGEAEQLYRQVVATRSPEAAVALERLQALEVRQP